MIILRADVIKVALPMDETIQVMKSAYAALSDGMAEVPLRAHLNIAPFEGTSLFMPCFVQDKEGEVLTLKVVSIFPHNLECGLPAIHGAVLMLEAQTGKPIALLEGGTLTAIRTGAASGAATDLLARSDAARAAIFGAGVQGRTQLEAICSVRDIETAWIYDPDRGKAQTIVKELAGKGRIPTDLRVAEDPANAARMAEIICTATTSKTPVYPADAIQPGTHINGVGSYTLDMIENPPEIFKIAIPYVDSVDAVLAESGEIVQAIQQEILEPEQLTEIGSVVLGRAEGRTANDQITFFKSVGVAVQDALATRLALQNALKMDLGQKVAW